MISKIVNTTHYAMEFNYGSAYQVTVSASEKAGEGIASKKSFTTWPFSGPVQQLTVTIASNHSHFNASLAWKPPANLSSSHIKVSKSMKLSAVNCSVMVLGFTKSYCKGISVQTLCQVTNPLNSFTPQSV